MTKSTLSNHDGCMSWSTQHNNLAGVATDENLLTNFQQEYQNSVFRINWPAMITLFNTLPFLGSDQATLAARKLVGNLFGLSSAIASKAYPIKRQIFFIGIAIQDLPADIVVYLPDNNLKGLLYIGRI